VREVSPGETAFGWTFEELMTGRSFEADSRDGGAPILPGLNLSP